MTAVLPNLRYEQKFVIHHLTVPEVLGEVKRHGAAFREVFPPRAVNNIYLDTPGMRDFHDHVNGATERVKSRVRWYGALGGYLARPTLERKFKRGIVSGKLSFALPPLTLNGGVDAVGLAAALAAADLPDMLRESLRQLQPALVNRYQRRYFLSGDGRLRLTVDWGLEFYGVRSNAGRMVPARLPDPGFVVELKFDPRDADGARDAASRLPFRLSRCSKYVLGVETTDAGL